MKNLFIALLLLCSSTAIAQSSFGVTAGLNYADNGKVEYSDVSGAFENIAEAERKTGYHFGVFYRAEIAMFYLKPELLYTQTTSSYDFNDRSVDYDVSTLDLPILVGVSILGPLDIFAGPSLRYVLSNDFDGNSIEEFKNEFTVGAQFGVGVQFGGIGIDIRYEQALSENQAEFLGLEGNPERIDSRPNQFIVSLSLDL